MYIARKLLLPADSPTNKLLRKKKEVMNDMKVIVDFNPIN